jgi:uncharacterized membrane protein YgdD (TMEM256/DUF423 family)
MHMFAMHDRRRQPSPLAAAGAVLAACAVALAAYAAHASAAAGHQGPLFTAAAIAFGHGLALQTLGPDSRRRLRRGLLLGLLLGTLLFCGSVVAAQLFGMSAKLAPLGGGLLILCWLGLGFDHLRR